MDDVPVNVPVNQRQQWFINQIQRNVMVSAKDIAEHWKVSEKTVKRDITDLKQKKVIAFSGAAKNGSYYLLG
ncbi:MAG: DeoR family transcriptional regulator [Desulfobacula sp.]|nr:DeoR family transcriptional regulator [Desulfobacula sp.]